MRTLLIIGFGDVARRAVPALAKRWRILALVRSRAAADACRALGVLPVLGDLDDAIPLSRLAGLADAVLYTAPPPASGRDDPRPRKLLSALAKTQSIPQCWVYISTTGVYGNRDGAWVDETARPAPLSDRAARRVSAECTLRAGAQRLGFTLSILRAPGIYAADRLPLTRLESGMPLIRADEDSVSNHIHADDLAALCVAALERRHGIRVYNACDDEPLAMGDWFDLLADRLGRPRLPRLPRSKVQPLVSPALWSYLVESRRIANGRIKRELKARLVYPSVRAFLAAQTVSLPV
jgi:nucleoside-diphosphate-sugar epimerase